MFAHIITLVIVVLIPHPTYGERQQLAHFTQMENVIFSSKQGNIKVDFDISKFMEATSATKSRLKKFQENAKQLASKSVSLNTMQSSMFENLNQQWHRIQDHLSFIILRYFTLFNQVLKTEEYKGPTTPSYIQIYEQKWTKFWQPSTKRALFLP